MAATTNSILLGEAGGGGLVSAALRGCPEMFSAFYNSHYRYVLRVCRHYLWHREDAEDAAAEVFLKLRQLESENNPIHSRSWLSKVTGRHCIDRLRRAKVEQRRRADDVEYDSLPDNLEGSPLARVLHREQQERVREGLRRLPREYRILLVLHYYRQLSYAEIALTLGKQVPAVKSGVFRAKRMLREKILYTAPQGAQA